MNVLITAPSLDVARNVSGISSVVNTIINNNLANNYIHFLEGREDTSTGFLPRAKAIFKSYWSLIQVFRKQQINLVHLNLPLNTRSIIREYLFFTIAKWFGKIIILHLHGGEFLCKKPDSRILFFMVRSMLRRSKTTVCLSTLEKEMIAATYGFAGADVLQNTVDDSFGKFDRSMQVYHQLSVLFLGRLHESKGLRVILESVELVLEKGHSNIQFLFCGAGPLLPELLALQHLYPNHVRYMGIVDGNKKLEILSKSQVFILPSLYGEGLPMSLLEAMAAGLVPIVTDDGSMASVVKQNETGLIIDKGSAASLAAQMEILIKNPAEVKRLGLNAKNYVAGQFSIQKYIYALNQLYKSAAA